MKIILIFISFLLNSQAWSMADPNFVPAPSPEVSPGTEDMMDTTATLNQLDKQEEQEDLKAAEEARIQAQEAADQQNYRYDVPTQAE
jgi:hypothetical protein